MKKNLALIGILVLIAFGTAIFTGCAKKQAVVNDEVVQEQKAQAAQSTDAVTVQAVKAPTDQEQAVKVEAAATAEAVKATAEQEQSAIIEAKAGQAVKVEAAATAEITVRDINFDFDAYSIRPDARGIMKANAKILGKKTNATITIEGHCDERGTAEYNLALGERRAQEAKKYLIQMGVKAAQIKTVSYGKEFSLNPGNNEHTEEVWAKNRRAHFVVKGK